MLTAEQILQPISAPIPVPGSQQEPTMPSATAGSAATGLGPSRTTIIHISGGGHAGSGGAGSNTSSHHSHNGNSASLDLNRASEDHAYQHPANSNNTSALRRFTSIGGSKKLGLENQTLRAKIAELERYLTGLKEELILAHRQIHAKNLEAKVSMERKAVEMHELGQHIQRCEVELLAKTAECEALQNKLQYQTKEQMTKLKHINLLETEIMDYRRMSTLSNGGTQGGSGSGGARLSRDLTHSGTSSVGASARSSTLMPDTVDAAQVRQLKEETTRKDQQIQELLQKVLNLEREKSDLEQQQQQAASTTAESGTPPATDEAEAVAGEQSASVSGSNSNASFNTASGPNGSIHSQTSSSVNSVGYDMAVEHPKLLAKFQALRIQHAQASEYLDSLENENRDLKIQLLDVITVDSTIGSDMLVMAVPMAAENVVPMAADSVAPTATLPPLDMAAATAVELTSDAASPAATSSPTHSDTTTSTSAPASPSSTAPALTPKSLLRYTKEDPISPTPAL